MRGFLIISLILVHTASYGQALCPSPAVHKATLNMVRQDTAIVRSYYRMPVFYHCKPLHAYTTIGMMSRTSMASYTSEAFEKYTRAVRRKIKSDDIGIVIDDMNFGTDSFYIVRFSPPDGRSDTAVFETPIFLSARPTKPYKVIRVLNDQLGHGSLNSTLQRYLADAGGLHVPYDGIMVRDVSYTFGLDQIYVFRWKN